MIYEFHPDAEEEFIEAAAYYERNVPGLGERFAREAHQAIERLLKYPEIGSPIDPNLRRIVLTRFPYLLPDLQLHFRYAESCRRGTRASAPRLLAIYS